MNSNTNFLINLIYTSTGLDKAKADIASVDTSVKKFGIGLNDISNVISTRFNQTTQRMTVNWRDAGNMLRTTTFDMAQGGVAINDVSQSTIGLSENLRRLVGRAALTIPVWLALRGAMMVTMRLIGESVKSFLDLDEALHNTQNELQYLGTRAPEFLERLKKSAKDLSVETGIGPAKIVETFRQFATAGIDAETSLAGMTTAVRGAIATMGDSVELGRLLADIYNQMGDRITEVSGPQNKFNYIMSTMTTLMPTNVFTIKEFGDALKNFVATAKGANLTLDETFTLVAAGATAMQRGAREGTQLTSAFTQMLSKRKLVEEFLGKSTTGIKPFDVYREVLVKASKLSIGGNLPRSIDEIFGNRGGRVTKALIADVTHLIEELDRLKELTPEERMIEFMDRYGTATDKAKIRVSQLGQALLALGETAISTLVEDTGFLKFLDLFTEKLKGAGIYLKAYIALLQDYYFFLNLLLKSGGGVFPKIEIFDDKAWERLQTVINWSTKPLIALTPLSGKDVFKGNDLQKFFESFTHPLGLVGTLIEDRAREEQLKQDNITRMRARQEKILNVRGLSLKTTDKDSEVMELEDRKKINNAILETEKERLEYQGALKSEILKMQDSLIDQLDIQEEEVDVVTRHLKLQQALTEEKRLQNRLSSDSMKLFEIAQKEGTPIAKKIGEVLSGEIDFDSFIRRGGKAAEVFQREFADKFKQQQAMQFFTGERVSGLTELRGGFNIPIQEERIRRTDTEKFNLSAELKSYRAERELINLQTQNRIVNQQPVTPSLTINATVNTELTIDAERYGAEGVNIINQLKQDSINEAFKEAGQKAIDLISEQFENPESKIYKRLSQSALMWRIDGGK
jgi:hypothetical protein